MIKKKTGVLSLIGICNFSIYLKVVFATIKYLLYEDNIQCGQSFKENYWIKKNK